jgi:pimeloyl-ACP methyl ester carboxylesterase
MKDVGLVLLLLWTSLSLSAQGISGQWNGVLKVPGAQLKLVFHISETAEGYSSTMDSPDQGAFGIPVTATTFAGSVLKLEIPNAGITYEGTLEGTDSIVGTFRQGGQSFPLILTTGAVEKAEVVRPQEPVPPFPYDAEEVTFSNEQDGVELAGTLTLPRGDGVFPAVVLISGSGPQNRDEELFEHKPFWVLADFLTRNGIAVLRFDDRGVGASTGDFAKATTFDFARDVEAAVDFLKTREGVNPKEIGLIGHSEGGVIAPMVASERADIGFIVLMAGSALRGDQLLLLQKATIEAQMGVPPQMIEYNQQIMGGAYEIVLNEQLDQELIADSLSGYFQEKYGVMLPEEQRMALVDQLSSPWMINFVRLDPAVYLSEVQCPLLALNGSKDLQVPSKENLDVITRMAEEHPEKQIITMELEGLNHLFQECETGAVSEYGTIEQTIAPIALETMLSWIMVWVE